MIADLQRALAANADAKSRDWWTRYLKHAIEFRGLGIPRIRELVAEWRDRHQLDALPLDEQFELAMTLMREPIAEDKLAGVLYLQNYLTSAIPWRSAVKRYASLFGEGFIHEWSTCDWFCVRVLGPTIQAHGMPAARAIASWHTAKNLWRARASAVGFVYLVKDERFHDLIERSCTTLIQREERFAKTAVGWVMRELSKHDAARVKRFTRKHEKHFSRESWNAATKFLTRSSTT